MTRFIRHANSKRLSPRTDGGRFATKPTLGLGVCACGRILVPRYETTGAGAVKHMPERCEDCADEGDPDAGGGPMNELERLAKAGTPTEYVEGEWMAHRPDMGWSAATVRWDETQGWCWRALNQSGTAETYDAARAAAANVLDAVL